MKQSNGTLHSLAIMNPERTIPYRCHTWLVFVLVSLDPKLNITIEKLGNKEKNIKFGEMMTQHSAIVKCGNWER